MDFLFSGTLAFFQQPKKAISCEDTISNCKSPVVFAAASKPKGCLRIRQARMGGSNVCLLVAEETASEADASDAAFVVETGLLGAFC